MSFNNKDLFNKASKDIRDLEDNIDDEIKLIDELEDSVIDNPFLRKPLNNYLIEDSEKEENLVKSAEDNLNIFSSDSFKKSNSSKKREECSFLTKNTQMPKKAVIKKVTTDNNNIFNNITLKYWDEEYITMGTGYIEIKDDIMTFIRDGLFTRLLSVRLSKGLLKRNGNSIDFTTQKGKYRFEFKEGIDEFIKTFSIYFN
ncbi:hypothetical protein A0H76_1592 [Hepatospora eriocheir]|uniref:Uncharacterized protein n=1 Tax=Hepatospora eriocheir TaxID=1081669 RepID=A0A1X0QGV2_9MICR|nr:hypothetical protein A0H76_1592 [Hepatospora eriocheir]